jgi:hypothetical protein
MSSKQAKSHRRFPSLIIIAGIALSVILLLTACDRGGFEQNSNRQASNETSLTFETIEQKDWPSEIYPADKPGLMVIASQEDISKLQAGSDETIRKLQELDYVNSFALIVFQGLQETGGYDVQIESVTLDGTTINVFAQFQAPTPEEEKVDLISSPYHLVKIQKSGLWDQEFLFQLIVEDTVVATLPPIQIVDETALTFITIEQKDWGGSGEAYQATKPGLMIISNQSDIANLGKWVTSEATSKLQELDFENSFALTVFQGWKDSGGYDVQIERITRAGTTINIYSQFHEPGPNEARTTQVTSPYHLVTVQKDWEWDQEFLFQLIVDDAVVATQPIIHTLDEIDLTFETIEQKNTTGTGKAYEAWEPGLLVTYNEADIASLGDWVTAEAISKLQELDFENSFALIVFQGWKGRGGYEVQIERITQAKKTVNIYAQFHTPESNKVRISGITSPYHIIQVQKSGDWDQGIKFHLIVSGMVAATLPNTQTLEETDLAFKTIEQENWARTGQVYEAIEPGLAIISRKPAKDAWDGWITNRATRKLQQLDYKLSFALIVFQGWKDNSGYDVQIERITRSGKTINIYAQFIEPENPKGVTAEATSPYHLVQVEKTWVWDQGLLFQLIVDDKVVSSLHTDSSKMHDLAYPPPPITPTPALPAYPFP